MNSQHSAMTQGNIYSILMNSKVALKDGNFYELNKNADKLQSMVDEISESHAKVSIGELKALRVITMEVMLLIQASINGIRNAQVEILQLKRVSTGLTTYCEDGTFGPKI